MNPDKFNIKRTSLAVAMLLAFSSPHAVSTSGDTDGSEFQVNTFTTSSQAGPIIALDADGDFVIAWESNDHDGDSYGIYAQSHHIFLEI